MVEYMDMTTNETFSLYNNIHTKDLLGFGTNGHTNYQKVADFLDLSKGDIAKISKVSEQSVRFDEKRIPALVSERLQQIANICQLVAEHFQDINKTALWFKTPNPLLGNISPRDMIRYGRYGRLMQFVLDARSQGGTAGEKEEK
jgi:hypothetical protein